VPRSILLKIAREYWGSEQEEIPSLDSDIIEQIVLDIEGIAADHFVDALPREVFVSIASNMNVEANSSAHLLKLKKSLMKILEESGMTEAVNSLLSSEDILNTAYTVIVRLEPPTALDRDEKLQRIVYECNKIGVIKFMAQPTFKESSIAEWVRGSGVEVTSSSKKVISEHFYDALMAKESESTKTTSFLSSTTKRARDSEGKSDARPAKLPKIEKGDVSQILGLCKPEPGLQRPIRWKVALSAFVLSLQKGLVPLFLFTIFQVGWFRNNSNIN
jgi:hypothetical protein